MVKACLQPRFILTHLMQSREDLMYILLLRLPSGGLWLHLNMIEKNSKHYSQIIVTFYNVVQSKSHYAFYT